MTRSEMIDEAVRRSIPAAILRGILIHKLIVSMADIWREDICSEFRKIASEQ